MKWILLSLVIGIFSSLAFADQMPPQWRLPNKGKDCVFQTRFSDGHTCGSKRYEVWTCAYPATATTPAGFKSYLLTCVYGSDIANGCNPTYMVNQVIEQE